MSHVLARHHCALERNSSVAGSIILTQKTDEADKSLQFAGMVQRLLSGSEEILTLYREKKSE